MKRITTLLLFAAVLFWIPTVAAAAPMKFMPPDAEALPAGAGMPAAPNHTLTVTFNYDFSTDNACSASLTTACLKQFNIYDLTTGTPVKLFSITAPAGDNTAVTGLGGTSGLISLTSGVHTFGATAQMADGTESSPNASTATATVKPGTPTNFLVSGS